MSKPAFYLGRMIDLNGDEHISSPASPRPHYNPDDPITHAGVVGMTGSGKTGLLIDLLEEAALSGLPSIVIDPRALDTQRLPDARFASMPAWLANPKSFSAAQKAFADWIYRKGTTRIYANDTLKVYSTLEDSLQDEYQDLQAQKKDIYIEIAPWSGCRSTCSNPRSAGHLNKNSVYKIVHNARIYIHCFILKACWSARGSGLGHCRAEEPLPWSPWACGRRIVSMPGG